MTTGLGSWVDGSGGGTPILAADLNLRDGFLDANGLIVPSSPNAKDDEFDGTSSVTWSDTPTAAATKSINSDSPAKLVLKTTTNSAICGLLQAVPGSYPYTITTRVRSQSIPPTATEAAIGSGVLIGPSSPTGSSAAAMFGVRYSNAPKLHYGRFTFGGTFSSETAAQMNGNALPLYYRMKVNSATSLDCSWSEDGLYWYSWNAAINPSFTPAVMGVYVAATTQPATAIFDFFRVT